MYRLWMVSHEAMAHKTWPNKAAIYTICVRRRRSWLVPTAWLNLVFTEENAFAMYLLKGNVRRRQIVVIHGILI